ncbi:MAG TPA: hypothetical protein EYG85_12545 [Crocinitomix sp.]|nr:hypothetical protein [Crocinitomix sp.]
MNNFVKTAVGTFVKEKINVGIVTYNGRDDVTVDELIDFLNKIYQLMDNKPFFLINDLTNDYGSFSNEIWRFLANDKQFNKMILHSIVISNSLGMKIQLNFFIKFLKPSFKVTQVKSKEKAYKLVDSLKKIIVE